MSACCAVLRRLPPRVGCHPGGYSAIARAALALKEQLTILDLASQRNRLHATGALYVMAHNRDKAVPDRACPEIVAFFPPFPVTIAVGQFVVFDLQLNAALDCPTALTKRVASQMCGDISL